MKTKEEILSEIAEVLAGDPYTRIPVESAACKKSQGVRTVLHIFHVSIRNILVSFDLVCVPE